MKHNWEMKKLGDILKLEYGKPLPNNKRHLDGKYPVYGANGIINRTNEYYYDKLSIIVGRKGSAGEINLTEDKFWPLDVTYYVIFNEKELDLKFLYNLLSTHNLPKLAKGVKPGINRNEVYSIKTKIPPLPEQKRIVAVLDEAFGAIAKAKENAEKNLANAKELFESYLNGVFEKRGEGWEEKRLGEIFKIKPSKDEVRKKLKKNDLVSFVPMEDLNILEKDFISKKEKKLEDVIDSYTYFQDDDVLLAKITPCFENGKIGIAKNLKNGVGFGSSEYIVFRSLGQIIPEYLYYFLSRKQFRNEGKKMMMGAVGHKRVSKEFIENYLILFPKSIEEQKSIVSKLDELSAETKRLEEIYMQKINDLEELKKSVLNKAFNGEV